MFVARMFAERPFRVKHSRPTGRGRRQSIIAVTPPGENPTMTATLARRPADSPAVYRRRRLVALALALALALVASVALLAAHVGHAGAELDGPPPPRPVYVVQPGDTLWSIARKVAPGGDTREVVGRLAESAGGAALVPGQRIELPAGLAR
jgi:Tfp pilus assembly protein FimV